MTRTLRAVVGAMVMSLIACGSTSPPPSGWIDTTPAGGSGGPGGGGGPGAGGGQGGGGFGGDAGANAGGRAGAMAPVGGQAGAAGGGGQAGGFACGSGTCAAGQVCVSRSSCSGSLTCSGPADAAGHCPTGQQYTSFCVGFSGGGCLPTCTDPPPGQCEDLPTSCSGTPDCDCVRTHICNGSGSCTTLSNGFSILCELQ